MHSPLIIDSATELDGTASGQVVIGGSHCGIYPAYLGARAGVRAIILNDAGVGRDRAGIAGLAYLAGLGIPAAAIDCFSARIGDGTDCARRGIVSFANPLAIELGCLAGQNAIDAAKALARAPNLRRSPPAVIEARRRLEGPWGDSVSVIAVDSASLVRPEDAGAIILAGSHGGLLGGDPASALKVDALAVLYNDARGGIDDAGYGRLPVLDRRGIAAATVDATLARIGDGESTYRDGILSRVNEAAMRLGGRPGMSAGEFVERIVNEKIRRQG
jgi:hypothetical protein